MIMVGPVDKDGNPIREEERPITKRDYVVSIILIAGFVIYLFLVSTIIGTIRSIVN